jgi:beta-xylosidase
VSIQQKMNELFESKIVSYSMDILENKLSLELELLENEVITNYSVEFMNVSTFYFINNTTDERKEIYPPEKDDYLELTSINLSNNIINISLDCEEEVWLKQYNGCGKVILEIWSKLVVLEANKFKVNDDVYDL